MLLYSESHSGVFSSTARGVASGVGSAGGHLPAPSQPCATVALGDVPCLLLEGLQHPWGHSDMWVPGGVPAQCSFLRGGGLAGGSSQLCRSLWRCQGSYCGS